MEKRDRGKVRASGWRTEESKLFIVLPTTLQVKAVESEIELKKKDNKDTSLCLEEPIGQGRRRGSRGTTSMKNAVGKGERSREKERDNNK